MSSIDVRSSLLFGDSIITEHGSGSDSKSPQMLSDENDILHKWRMRQKKNIQKQQMTPNISTPDQNNIVDPGKSPHFPIPAGRQHQNITPVASNHSSKSATPYHTPLPNNSEKMKILERNLETLKNLSLVPNTSIIDQNLTKISSPNYSSIKPQPVKIIVHQTTQTERNNIRNVGLQVNYKKPQPQKFSKSTETEDKDTKTCFTQCEPEPENLNKSDITEISDVQVETRDFAVQTETNDDKGELELVAVPENLKDDPMLQYFDKLQNKVMNSLNEVDEFLKETDFLDDYEYKFDFDDNDDDEEEVYRKEHIDFEQKFNEFYD